MLGELVSGSFDIHVHCAPSLFPRWGDAVELARECASHGMAGFVVKSHHGSSIETAYLLSQVCGGMKIYGGVTLNYFTGGLNPYSVDAALRLGAKFVWLPTIHASNHGKVFGTLGGFHFQKSGCELQVIEGISIVDKNGKIKDALRNILDLIDGKPVVLATGHLSTEEIFYLQKYIKSEGLDIRVLVNHALFKAPALTVSQIKQLSNDRTWFETVYLTVSPVIGSASVGDVALILKATPEAHWIMASDSGQMDNLKSPQALAEYAGLLLAEGIDRDRVGRMLRDEPQALLSEV